MIISSEVAEKRTKQEKYDVLTMLEKEGMSLQELARAYADGQMDFQEYRRVRTQLLDRITGEATVIVNYEDITVEQETHSRQRIVDVRYLFPNSHVIRWLISTCVVVTVLMLWWVLY
jgi:hypothetical protein